MKLYLLRHATANEADIDPERGLSAVGVAEANRMVAVLGQFTNLEVKVVLHSGKKRAQQTAEIISTGMLPTPKIMTANNLEPNGDVEVWVERALTMEENVMLVGHLPHLGRLAACLLTRDENKEVFGFRTATLACLERHSGGSWSLNWLLDPSILR
ncbi:MAG: phosphohistidine phosphatase SixA [bacterium]